MILNEYHEIVQTDHKIVQTGFSMKGQAQHVGIFFTENRFSFFDGLSDYYYDKIYLEIKRFSVSSIDETYYFDFFNKQYKQYI